MKKVQRINESQLRAIVAESVKKVLNEGSTYMSSEDIINAWYKAKEILGYSEFLSAIYKALGEDSIKELLIYINRNYEIGLFQN